MFLFVIPFLFASFTNGDIGNRMANRLAGYWLVTIDNTDQSRKWNRIYYFEKCSSDEIESLQCKGHFGWAEFDGVYLNLYDKNYLTYGLVEDPNKKTGKGVLNLSGIDYSISLDWKVRCLELYDKDNGELIMSMKKVKKSELK